MVHAVPQELREGSFAMGATKWQTTMKVVLPAAFGGVITGLIISIGRAAGETAPIMFTAAVGSLTARSFTLLDPTAPVMALPYQLYYKAWLAPSMEWTLEMQYGIALVLLILVLSIFSLATVIRYRYNKKVKW
jgi:phosphate transport system permease protein